MSGAIRSNSTVPPRRDLGDNARDAAGLTRGMPINSTQALRPLDVSRPCYDDAVMENFFGHLKDEAFHHVRFLSIDTLETALHEYTLVQPRPDFDKARRPEPGAVPNSGPRCVNAQ